MKRFALKDRTLLGSLLTHAGDDTGWRPPEVLPELSAYKEIGFDTETSGLDFRAKAEPIGFCLGLPTENGDAKGVYLPFKHQGGGNFDPALMKRWAERELRDKVLYMSENKVEIRALRKMGVDLEKQGCQVRECQFRAGLLDDTRRSFKLNDMLKDYLGEEKVDIDHTLIWQMPAYDVGPYGEQDGRGTYLLGKHLDGLIEKENLTRACKLEDDLVWATLHMEDNGVPLDVPKLQAWNHEINKRYFSLVQEINEIAGFKVNVDSPIDLARLFAFLNIPHGYTKKGAPSFPQQFLKSVDDDNVRKISLTKTLTSLKSKYVGKYLKAVRDGMLYYKLHQMKADNEQDEGWSGTFGTISGRYSSSSVNIQQVFAPSKQIKKMGFSEFLIRELFIPRPGRRWVRADAKQIEYRIFVHYSKSERLIQRYREDPDLNFHKEIQEMVQQYTDINYDNTKNLNFAKLYAAGIDKIAAMTGMSRNDAESLVKEYDRAVPEAKAIVRQAMNIAKERGHVLTILKRRARFDTPETADRIHSAFNRVCQGSAAEIMKLKILETYNERKFLNLHMFFTVHDELDGDTDSDQDAARFRELLDTQIEELKMRVPIRWDVQLAPENYNCWAGAK